MTSHENCHAVGGGGGSIWPTVLLNMALWLPVGLVVGAGVAALLASA